MVTIINSKSKRKKISLDKRSIKFSNSKFLRRVSKNIKTRDLTGNFKRFSPTTIKLAKKELKGRKK